MSTRTKAVQITTPAGEAVWPSLNEPNTKWDAAGKYEAKLRLNADLPAVQDLQAQGEKLIQDFLEAEKDRLKAEKKAALAAEIKAGRFMAPERDQESGDETGFLLFKATMKASGKRDDGSTWSQKPSIFDAKGNPLKNPPRIGGGSTLKVAAKLEPFLNNTTKEVQLSVRLQGVQVISLVSGGERSFSGLGFQAEDGDEIEDQAVSFTPADAGPDGNDDL